MFGRLIATDFVLGADLPTGKTSTIVREALEVAGASRSEQRPHTQVALGDAIEQGELFCRMLAELKSQG